MVFFTVVWTFLITMVAVMIFNAFHDKVDYRTVSDARLPKSFQNFRIFFISDIHRRHIRLKTLQSIEDTIDIVVIGGDLTEKGVPLKRTKENIERLKRWHVPIYFVWGNNDYEWFPIQLSEMLVEEGVIILANQFDVVTRGNEKIRLLGLDYSPYRNIQFAKANRNNDANYSILLVHSPFTFQQELTTEQQDCVQLVLAGHTHGGQIRVMNIGPYKKGGLKKIRNIHFLVSEGYGYSFLPFRLETKAECHVIKLVKE